MSAEQRDFFLSQLGSSLSKATIHVLPKQDVEAIAEEARDMGFLADVLMNDDEEDSQALLVVGRDDAEMDRVLARVKFVEQSRNPGVGSAPPSAGGSSPGSALKSALGGAVVGAVGAWAGLAWS